MIPKGLKYDIGTYNIDLKQSTAPLQWILDPNRIYNKNLCRPNNIGYLSKYGTSVSCNYDLTDIDSELKGLHYKLTKNPNNKYIKNKSKINENKIKYQHYTPCNIGTESTRLTIPSCTFRSIGVNRFQPLPFDLQNRCFWEHPSETGINYRLVVKDNHKPIIPNITNYGNNNKLNNGHFDSCQKIITCGTFLDPLHKHYKK